MTPTQIEAFPELVGVSNKESDERYTLGFVRSAALKLAKLKKWTLDVAACVTSHLADRYYTKQDNGLISSWWGDVVCNPPWSNIEDWVKKAWVEWNRRLADERRVVKTITMILPSNRTDLDWWQKHVEPFRDKPGSPLTTHYLPFRNKYGTPEDPKGVGQGTPEFGTVVLLWKDRG